ncbi:MAG: magnesium transporter [Candidatus Berkiella sp.]
METSTYQSVIQKLQTEFLASYPVEAASELEALDKSELLKIVKTLSFEDIEVAIQKLSTDTLIVLFEELDNETCHKIINSLSVEKINAILSGVAIDKKQILWSFIPKNIKSEIHEIHKYPAGTAGYLMDHNIIIFTPTMTIEEAIQKIKARHKMGIRLLYITDEDGKLHSMVTAQELMLADKNQLLMDISKPVPAIIDALAQKDEIQTKIEQYQLTDIPVIDIHHHFIGVVQHPALIQITREELTKDIQTMFGVSQDERALSKVFYAVRKRLPWLEINLLTALLAASVVGLFENTLAKFTALAVLLPVVSGQSGNTGAQALAVTMRGLAIKEVRTSQGFLLILKELQIALVTGLVVALSTALAIYVWSHSYGLALIIAISMITSMILAGMSGAAVPLLLSRLGFDPASSSSILLTTITDVTGFFSFLGIATLLSSLI